MLVGYVYVKERKMKFENIFSEHTSPICIISAMQSSNLISKQEAAIIIVNVYSGSKLLFYGTKNMIWLHNQVPNFLIFTI